MAVVTELRIGETFFIIPPEPLNTTGTLVFVSHVVPPSTLNAASHVMPISISHGFQSKKLMLICELKNQG